MKLTPKITAAARRHFDFVKLPTSDKLQVAKALTGFIVDWIKARLDCSPLHVWAALCDRVKHDVQRWRELTKSDESINMTADDRSLRVSKRLRPEGNTWATIRLENGRLILQKSTEPKNFLVTRPSIEEYALLPTVNSDGECCLIHKDKELQVWQVSRIALESVLF